MIAIKDIQGAGYISPLSGQTVTCTGFVTGVLRRGFFIQTPDVIWDGESSDGLFVYSPDWLPEKGWLVEVSGIVRDYVKHDTAKPVTQLQLESAKPRRVQGQGVKAITLSQEMLRRTNFDLAITLNSLEGMLLRIPAGQTFIAPSNRYGDYVLALDSPERDESEIRNENGGLIPREGNDLRWFPGFRVSNYNYAQRLNLGSKLLSDIEAPLNYRADSYQLSLNEPFEFEPAFHTLTESTITPTPGSVSVMTLNCFNLDPHVEGEGKVMNPSRDVDDDWGDGRFHTLAQAIVLQANCPDIVALQEIQDNDGAELSEEVSASKTYELLTSAIEQLSGVLYRAVDIAPKLGEDGGQPGGNIRNAYLYNPERVELKEESLQILGADEDCYKDSRKPLYAEFEEKTTHRHLALINIHLASKRHQQSIFASTNAGVDGKLEVRCNQADVIYKKTQECLQQQIDFYVTGDFNDSEYSRPLQILCGDSNINLVMDLPEEERYDYNHRGKLQVLMHGIVGRNLHEQGRAKYEIIHGNELLGVEPGEESDKPSDHAYVIAEINLGG